LWIGTPENPVAAVQAAAQANRLGARLTVSTDVVRARVEAAAKDLEAAPPAARQQGWWRMVAAQQLERQGRLDEALQAAAGQRPAGWTELAAGDLTLILERAESGVRLLQLYDAQTRQPLLTQRPAPLFSLTLRHAETKEEVRLAADSGWGRTEVLEGSRHPRNSGGEGQQPSSANSPNAGDGRVELRWRSHSTNDLVPCASSPGPFPTQPPARSTGG